MTEDTDTVQFTKLAELPNYRFNKLKMIDLLIQLSF